LNSDVDDIRQEVFLSIWEKGLLTSLRQPERVVAWLAILSANKTVNYFKKKSQKLPSVSSLFDVEDLHNPSPIEAAIHKESFKKALWVIKKELSSKEKIVLRLSVLYNKTHAQIAQTLNMPIGSVATHIKRAKIKIKNKLKI